jgi:hypothetical protein
MLAAAQRAKHVILGTATPVQTDVEELWDLLEVLNQGTDHILGRYGSPWRRPAAAIPVLGRVRRACAPSAARRRSVGAGSLGSSNENAGKPSMLINTTMRSRADGWGR